MDKGIFVKGRTSSLRTLFLREYRIFAGPPIARGGKERTTMSKLGKRLIASAKEARAIARMTRKTFRSAEGLTTLDDFLKREGKLEEFEALAIKEVGRGKSARRRRHRLSRASA